MAYQSFKDLEVWKRARNFKNEIYTLVKRFPTEEKLRLSDQLIRSYRCINSQIAEGHGRQTNPDRLRFCIVTRGSLGETLNHLIDAFDCQLISHKELGDLRTKVSEIEKLLNGYISFLQKKSITK